MPTNSETILSGQVHPGDSSVETVTGEKFKGDGYYGRADGFHTIQLTVNGFIGTINIQATLAIDPVSAGIAIAGSSPRIVGETANLTGYIMGKLDKLPTPSYEGIGGLLEILYQTQAQMENKQNQ